MRKILALSVLMLLAGVLGAQQKPSFQVVVNSSNAVSSISRAEISRLFLKKKTRWDDGRKVLPVDQVEERSVRQAFSKQIHNKEVDRIKSYWHQMIFSGRATAPPQLTSDSEVLEYVKSNTGAIGYVAKDAPLGDGLNVVEITD